MAHAVDTVSSEAGHGHGMVLAWVWDSADCDVAVPDRLDLEDASSIGDLVELAVQGLEESEDL